MENKTILTDAPQKGNILIINTGSTTTKLGYYSDGKRVFDEKLEHTADEVAKYKETPCIRCGRCVSACPEFLVPRPSRIS